MLCVKQETEPCLGPQGRLFKAGDGCFSRALTDEWELHQAWRGRGSLLREAQPADGQKERRLPLPATPPGKAVQFINVSETAGKSGQGLHRALWFLLIELLLLHRH